MGSLFHPNCRPRIRYFCLVNLYSVDAYFSSPAHDNHPARSSYIAIYYAANNGRSNIREIAILLFLLCYILSSRILISERSCWRPRISVNISLYTAALVAFHRRASTVERVDRCWLVPWHSAQKLDSTEQRE